MRKVSRRVCGTLLAATALALLSAATAGAQIQLVQTLATGHVSQNYQLTIPISASTTVGNRLVLAIADPGITQNSVRDTKGNTWTRDVSPTSAQAEFWSAQITTADVAGDSVVVNFAAPGVANYALYEFNGIDPTSPVDASRWAAGSSATTSSDAITTTASDDLLLSALQSGSGTFTPPSDQTLLTDDQSVFHVGENADAATGPHTGAWSWTTATSWYEAQVAYRANPTCSGNTPNIHEYVDGCPLYNAGSWVNAPLPTSAPVDPNSASMAQVQLKTMGLNPDGTLASGSQQGQRWWEGFDVYVQNSTDRTTWKTVCSTEVLSGASWSWMDQLHNAWVTFKAPIPAGGLPALDGGGDQGATVYNAPTGEMWDFYQWKGAAPAGTTDPQGRPCDYEAAGGDYQNDIAHHPGYFINQSLGSGVTESNQWGRRAAALPSMAGVITPDEWNNPLPDLGHTLQIIVGCADTQKQYWPATRHDGCTAGNGGLPEGARVRIAPSYVCPHGTAGSSGPTQLAYDRAYSFCATLQKYGAVVTDQTGGGTTFTFASVRGGKSNVMTPDGGNCCTAGLPVGTGTQWPNWYWDVDVDRALPGLQVIDQSYRPPFAPAQ